MDLYPHQKKFIDDNPRNAILCYETGCGKSHVAKLWASNSCRNMTVVVVCPKQIVKEWKKIEGFVYSFDFFKKAVIQGTIPQKPTAIVVDEADMMSSPLYEARKRSQRTEALFNYIMDNPQADVLLLTATPVRSTPANMHTLLVLSRIIEPTKDCWERYRDAYYSLQNPPFLPRPAYLPIAGWQKLMQPLIDKYTYTALMSDIIDLPPREDLIIKLPAPDYDENDEWKPASQFVADHRLEQKNKHKAILEIARGFRKVVVVCKYTSQIEDLADKLSKERQVFVVNGKVRDQEEVIRQAEASPECFLIVQAQIAAGYELPSFSVMVFASMSYGARDYTQMCGRIKRINHIKSDPKPVRYYYLLAGRCDRMVYNAVKNNLEFIPSSYLAKKKEQERSQCDTKDNKEIKDNPFLQKLVTGGKDG